jgi:transposase
VNKHYPPQFKADAVALYRSRPRATIAQIADDLEIDRETLRSWVRIDDRRGGNAAAAPGGPVAAGSVEAELRRRIRELKEERDILRKAARCFAGETRSLVSTHPRPRPTPNV